MAHSRTVFFKLIFAVLAIANISAMAAIFGLNSDGTGDTLPRPLFIAALLLAISITSLLFSALLRWLYSGASEQQRLAKHHHENESAIAELTKSSQRLHLFYQILILLSMFSLILAIIASGAYLAGLH